MVNINERVNEIYNYLLPVIDIGESGKYIIYDSISAIRQISPIDGAQLFSKMEKIISLSDDLSWVVSSINRKRNCIESDLKSIKDPKYVALVRQNRPSSAAIEAEIRITIKDVSILDNQINILDNILSYLDSIQRSLDRYIWMLRDKISYSR